MKIKTITCHNVYNYGASLQSFALMHFLETKGHDVSIIDYKPFYQKHHYCFTDVMPGGMPYKIAKVMPLLKPLMGVIQHRSQIKFLLRKKAFDYFSKHFLKLTKRYTSCEELMADKPEADLYIAGSDQIWNTNLHNGADPSFYCLFEQNSQKCISYAASFATNTIDEKYIDFVKKGLANFRSISVRETTGVTIARQLGFKATAVLDPVFLLDSEWFGMSEIKNKERYILIYDFFQDQPIVKEYAQALARERSLKIYSINDFRECKFADKNINNAGPLEFLSYIRNADFVLSTSFHATAFSLIFNRQFLTFPLGKFGNTSRMSDFLELMGLSNRLILHDTFKSVNYLANIDYHVVAPILQKYQKLSRDWLMSNIQS